MMKIRFAIKDWLWLCVVLGLMIGWTRREFHHNNEMLQMEILRLHMKEHIAKTNGELKKLEYAADQLDNVERATFEANRNGYREPPQHKEYEH